MLRWRAGAASAALSAPAAVLSGAAWPAAELQSVHLEAQQGWGPVLLKALPAAVDAEAPLPLPWTLVRAGMSMRATSSACTGEIKDCTDFIFLGAARL